MFEDSDAIIKEAKANLYSSVCSKLSAKTGVRVCEPNAQKTYS